MEGMPLTETQIFSFTPRKKLASESQSSAQDAGLWYSTRNTMPMFRNLEDLLSAKEQTVWQNPKNREDSGTWKSKFLKRYEKHYGKKLNIPRWSNIEDNYMVKK